MLANASRSIDRVLVDVCREIGLSVPRALSPGRWAACDVFEKGSRGRGDGRVLLTEDNSALIVKNWISGETRVVFLSERRSPVLRVVKTSEHVDAAQRAQSVWLSSRPAEDHPYLQSKKIQPHGARVFGDALVIPALDENGDIATLQYIKPDGSKKFLAGGRTKGCYYPVGDFGKSPDLIYIAEGFATGATVHEATGAPVAVAFNANNLAPVAQMLRQKYPAAQLVIAADDDAFSERNAGVNAALQAAAAVGGSVVLPMWLGKRPEKSTDFNDLAADEGLERVRECLRSHAAVQKIVDDAPDVPDADAAENENEIDPRAREQILHEARGRLLPDLGRYMRPYPAHALGPLHEVAREIAEGKQLAIPIAGNALLATASLLVSPHWRVRTIDGEAMPLSLYTLTAAVSGAGKDTAESIALRPIIEWQEKANEHYQKMRAEYAQRLEEIKRESRKQKRGNSFAPQQKAEEEPEPPRAPHRICKDMTVEGLRHSFSTGAPAQGVFTTEAASILLGHGFTQEQRSKTSAIISDLYSSGTLSVLRATGGRFEKYGLRLVMHLASQPEIIGEVLRDPKMSASGLWPRFLLAWPELPPERKHKKWTASQSKAVRDYWQRCTQLLELPMPENCNSGLVIELSPGAEKELGRFFEDLEIRASVRRGGELVPVRPFAVRATELATRIAGVLAAWRGAGVVSLDDARCGIELANYSLEAWRRAKDPFAEDHDVAAALELLEWLTTRPSWQCSARDILRSAPRRLRKAEMRDRAIERLKMAGFITVDDAGTLKAVMPASKSVASPFNAVDVEIEIKPEQTDQQDPVVEEKEIECLAAPSSAPVPYAACATSIDGMLSDLDEHDRARFYQLLAQAENPNLSDDLRDKFAAEAIALLESAEKKADGVVESEPEQDREPGSDDDWSDPGPCDDELESKLPPRPDWWK